MKEMRKRKKSSAFLTGLLAFAMTTSYFYAPSTFIDKENVVEASTIGQTWNFGYTGNFQTFTVPHTGVYKMETWGAQGSYGYSNYVGGKGGYAYGEKTFVAGTVLYVYVGQNPNGLQAGGWNGGGSANIARTDPGGGGGATDIRTVAGAWNNASGLNSRIIVAGGGAGGNHAGGEAGAGGGLVSGGNFSATQTAAGAGGGFGFGANISSTSSYPNGGGGGGYYGGGGIQGGVGNYISSSGGSSYYGNLSNAGTTPGIRTGHGQAVVTYIKPIITSQSPANNTKFQSNYIDVSWSNDGHPKYEIKAGTTSGGTNVLAVTNKGISLNHRLMVPAGTPGNTTIYWSVRGLDDAGNPSSWKEQSVIYSNNVPMITATPNTPVKLDVSLEKRNHGFSINSLKDSDDFNYVTLFADVLDGSGNVISGSKKQIVLDSSLVSSAQLINDSTEKKGSLQGPFNHTTPFNLKLSLQPDFTTGKFDLTLTKADGVTNVIKSGQKLLTARTMQATSATAAENYTLRIYPEDRQNTNALSTSPLAGINDITPIRIPFTSDTRNYLPNLTNVKHDVAKRVFSDAQGFNRISVTGHVDDSDPADKVTMYYEVQPKASNYAIQVKTVSGKVVPKSGVATQTFNPKVNHDFAFTYQIDPNLDSGNYALLVYGYDTQEGLGDYVEIPFTVDRGAPTIDFVADYTVSGKTIKMSSAQKQVVAEDNKVKLYFTPNNYATFEYAGYLIRGGAVKDLRIRGAFTNDVKASFIGVDLGKDPITLLDGATTDFKLGDVVIFKFKATSATGIKTTKDVRILIGDDASNFTPLDDAKIPSLP